MPDGSTCDLLRPQCCIDDVARSDLGDGPCAGWRVNEGIRYKAFVEYQPAKVRHIEHVPNQHVIVGDDDGARGRFDVGLTTHVGDGHADPRGLGDGLVRDGQRADDQQRRAGALVHVSSPFHLDYGLTGAALREHGGPAQCQRPTDDLSLPVEEHRVNVARRYPEAGTDGDALFRLEKVVIVGHCVSRLGSSRAGAG